VTERTVPAAVPLYEIPEWRERHGVIAGITARGAERGPGFDLGLWTREPVADVMSRWLAFRRALPGFHAVVLGNQVHGTELVRVEEGRGWIQLEGVDGWVTARPGVLLTVTVADCIPIYLVVPGRGVGLLHAGWRGTAGDILAGGVALLAEATTASPGDIIMHCGVGICGRCYEVGREVMTGCGVPHEGPGPWRLDLRRHLVERARALGVRELQVSSWCSAHDRPLFYSHRASGGTDGRMVAFVGIPVVDSILRTR
jgi:YfiH family protein